MKEFLHLSGLDQFIAGSEGALHAFSVRCEEEIIRFGNDQERILADRTLKKRKISVGLDEIYRGGHPCLVAIELVSGYILLEGFEKNRTAETWCNALQPRLEASNVEVDVVVGDLSSSLKSVADKIGAGHVPELFHALYDISKATAAKLSAQERLMGKELARAEAKLRKIVRKHGENSAEFKQATYNRNLNEFGLRQKQERSQQVVNAKKELGELIRPIDLKTGKIRKVENIGEEYNKHFKLIEQCVRDGKALFTPIGKVRSMFGCSLNNNTSKTGLLGCLRKRLGEYHSEVA